MNPEQKTPWEKYKDEQEEYFPNIEGHWRQNGDNYIEPKCMSHSKPPQLDNSFWDDYKDFKFWDKMFPNEKAWDYRKQNAAKYFAQLCTTVRNASFLCHEDLLKDDFPDDEDEHYNPIREKTANNLYNILEDLCKHTRQQNNLKKLFKNAPCPPYFPGACPDETKMGQDGDRWKSTLVKGFSKGPFNKAPIYVWKNLITDQTIGFHPEKWDNQVDLAFPNPSYDEEENMDDEAYEDFYNEISEKVRERRMAEDVVEYDENRRKNQREQCANKTVSECWKQENCKYTSNKGCVNLDDEEDQEILKRWWDNRVQQKEGSFQPKYTPYFNYGIWSPPNQPTIKLGVGGFVEEKKDQSIINLIDNIQTIEAKNENFIFIPDVNRLTNSIPVNPYPCWNFPTIPFDPAGGVIPIDLKCTTGSTTTFFVPHAYLGGGSKGRVYSYFPAKKNTFPTIYNSIAVKVTTDKTLKAEMECRDTVSYFDNPENLDLSLLIYQKCITPKPLDIAELVSVENDNDPNSEKNPKNLDLIGKKLLQKPFKGNFLYELHRSVSVLVMERMFGTILDLFKSFVVPISSKEKIVLEVQKALRFLCNNNRVYTDLKLDNVFFNICKGHKSGRNIKTPIYPNHLQIKLGDLASICKVGEFNVTTYPAPSTWKVIYNATHKQAWNLKQLPQKCSEASMVWQLATFTLIVFSSVENDRSIPIIIGELNAKLASDRSTNKKNQDTYYKAVKDLAQIRDDIEALKQNGSFGDLPVSNLKKVFSLENHEITLETIFNL